MLAALETHDEKRLTDGTGLDVWTGADFWGLGFRKSDLLRNRFVGAPQRHPQARELLGYYRQLIDARLDHRNRALRGEKVYKLRTRQGHAVDPRLYAAARWTDDGKVVFVVHNLWPVHAAQRYYIPPALAAALSLRDELRYRRVDAISGQQQGACRSGADLKWDFYVALDAGTRAQWLRLERCD